MRLRWRLRTRRRVCADTPHAHRRLHISLPEADGVTPRFVSILRVGGRLHCLDSTCYHAGGPLGAGDIEEVDGRACVSCPWHAYKVTLDTGEKLYRATELVRAARGASVAP